MIIGLFQTIHSISLLHPHPLGLPHSVPWLPISAKVELMKCQCWKNPGITGTRWRPSVANRPYIWHPTLDQLDPSLDISVVQWIGIVQEDPWAPHHIDKFWKWSSLMWCVYVCACGENLRKAQNLRQSSYFIWYLGDQLYSVILLLWQLHWLPIQFWEEIKKLVPGASLEGAESVACTRWCT